MKQFVPWPIKFAAKLAFGAFGVDYKVLKRFHLVEYGKMESANFARSVFHRHVTTLLDSKGRPEGNLLELGPGDSLATGLLGRGAGFDSVTLIDAGLFADLSAAALTRLADALKFPEFAVSAETASADVANFLERKRIRYLTEGLSSLRTLARNSVHHSFSNSVLQHVRRAEVADIIHCLGNAHAPGTLSSHLIKLNDHFSGGFHHERLPDWFMESALVQRANLYTNRVSALTYVRMFEDAGLILRRASIDFADQLESASVLSNSAAEFTRIVAGRRVLRVVFVFEKVSA